MSINDVIKSMELINGVSLEDMPEIDLYMDQVIQLFESKLSPIKRNDDEKMLTKTMINNYAKGKLLFPIKNKKYSKEHLILMAFIYNLKGALSINDIKSSLDYIIDEYTKHEDFPLRELYGAFLEKSTEDIYNFKEDLTIKANEVENILQNKKQLDGEYEKKFLLLCSLVNMSNMYRRASEKLIDEFFTDIKGDNNEKLK